MGGNRWGPLEWVLWAIPFVLPAVVVFRMASGAAQRLPTGEKWIDRAVFWLGLIVVSVLGYLFGAMFIAMMFVKPIFSARVVSRGVQCKTNLKQLSGALMMYAQDWDETYPPDDRWGDLAARHLPRGEEWSTFRCPMAESRFGYAFNRSLDVLPWSWIERPTDTVVLFESDAMSRNSVGDRLSLAAFDRHSGASQVALADGHVDRVSPSREAQLVWSIGNGVAPDRVAAVAIARRAVAKNDTWADRAIYEARREGDGWSVTAWRIEGYRPDGKPKHVPGGFRVVTIDKRGKAVRYLRGH